MWCKFITIISISAWLSRSKSPMLDPMMMVVEFTGKYDPPSKSRKSGRKKWGLHSHFLGFIWRLRTTMPINANIKHPEIPATFVVIVSGRATRNHLCRSLHQLHLMSDSKHSEWTSWEWTHIYIYTYSTYIFIHTYHDIPKFLLVT